MLDADGNAYITGFTFSPDFPVVNAFQATYQGEGDAFVVKLNSSGSALVYSTYLGGGGMEGSQGKGIAVDTAGNAYVVGETTSPDFPTVNALQGMYGGNGDIFITKFDPTGRVLYSTYLGSTDEDVANDVGVDPAGNAYVTGATSSTDFPTVNPVQPANANGGCCDAVVLKLDPTGSTLIYSTYLGGSGNEQGGFGIAVDAEGTAYVVGQTDSIDFPVAQNYGAFQGGIHGASDAFVAKLVPTKAIILSAEASGNTVTVTWDQLIPFERCFVELTGANRNSFYSPDQEFSPCTTTGVKTRSVSLFPTFLMPPILYTVISDDGPGKDLVSDYFLVYNTAAGSNVTSATPNGVSATFETVSTPGITTVTVSGSGPAAPAGFSFGNPPTYYDIRTTASFTGVLKVCITYDPARYIAPLSLMHYENNAWADVTISNDTTNNVICGAVSSLSPFAVAGKVPFTFTGFFRPVENLPVFNALKAGSAVPVKFSLAGNQGLTIFEAGYPQSQTIACDPNAIVDGVDETVTAGASGLSYDAATDQYVYVWKTLAAWANTCRQFVLKLRDGTVHRVDFKFKK